MNEESFDSVILIDALNGMTSARAELARGGRRWISRLTWIEVMSKLTVEPIARVETFLRGFAVDDVSDGIADRAAALRRERPRLKLPDAVIFASAQVAGRVLVTRNTKDFPAGTPGVRIPYTIPS